MAASGGGRAHGGLAVAEPERLKAHECAPWGSRVSRDLAGEARAPWPERVSAKGEICPGPRGCGNGPILRLAALRPPARDGLRPALAIPGLAGDPLEGPHRPQAQQQRARPLARAWAGERPSGGGIFMA